MRASKLHTQSHCTSAQERNLSHHDSQIEPRENFRCSFGHSGCIKLLLFVISQVKPGKRIEISPRAIIPGVIVGCVHRKGLIYNNTVEIRYNKFYRLYIEDR